MENDKRDARGRLSVFFVSQDVLHLAVQYITDAGQNVGVNAADISVVPFIYDWKCRADCLSQFIAVDPPFVKQLF